MSDIKSRLYKGYRIQERSDGVVDVYDDEGNFSQLPLHYDLCQHSISGFNWGYGGSGPTQLAFSLLYDVTENQKVAHSNAQNFKWDVLARIPTDDDWQMTFEEINDWLLENSKETRNE